MKNTGAKESPQGIVFYLLRVVSFCKLLAIGLALVGLTAGNSAAQSAQAVSGRTIAGNTPGFISMGKKLGAEPTSTTISLTLWLQPHNQAALDTLAEQLYDKTSPNYHKWLKPAELKAKFAPTEEDVNTVKQFLIDHNLKFTRVGPANFSVTAEGTVGEVQKAFSVQIDRFQVGSETHRGNTSDPYIEGAASEIVSAVYGLDDYQPTHPFVTAKTAFASKAPTTKAKAQAQTSAGPISNGIFYSGQCFTGIETQTFTSNGALPFATFTGNGFGQSIAGGGLGALAPCGYDPAEIQTAYNLNGLYAEGFHGEGQTIVILDWFGSPYITQDANVFSNLNGLPPLTSSNFNIVYYPVNCNCGGIDEEINLDVEWSHAVAPGANIVLLVPPSGSFADVDNATVFAITEGLGNVISGSFSAIESQLSKVVLSQESLVSELAAVSGISTNYSSGDFGDYSTFDIPATVSAPADVPFATSVGGVSLALNSDNSIAWQSGWGTNITAVVGPPSFPVIFDPPLNAGFFFGSGGGSSAFFAKPKFQQKLAGKGRQVPDISWLADLFTGVEVVLYDGNGETVEVIGGTSVACPMFSALWAIANQEAGEPLGQAAPYLYNMPASTITDIVPVGSSTNPKGFIQDSAGITHYTAAELAAPLDGSNIFFSAIYNNIEDIEWDIVTFGTDTGLKTKKGWDNVTGLGTPNAQAFADFFAAGHLHPLD